MDWMPQAIREGIFTILFISGPLVVLAAALGLAVGVLQAATQVQEQTLGSAVKVIGLFIALIIFGFYMFQYMSRYATDSINKAFKLVPTLTAKVLPRRNFLETPIQDTEKQIQLPTVTEGPSGGSGGASKIAEAVNEPEVENINENLKINNKIAPPPSQTKPFPDVDKLKAQKLTQTGSSTTPAKSTPTPAKPVQTTTAPVATKAAPATAKPATTVTPVAPKPAPAKVVTPAPAKPAPVAPPPVVVPEEPKPPVVRIPRPAITGRLDKLKEEAVR